MSMSIKLDAAALAALFPEGTEARVELQRAVLAEFCRQHIKASWIKENIEDELRQLRTRIRAEVLETIQVKNSWGEFTALFKDELRTQVQGEVKSIRDQMIKEEVESRFEDAAVMRRIEQIVDLKIHAVADPLVRGLLHDKVMAIVGALPLPDAAK